MSGQLQLQLELVSEWDAVGAHGGDLRLEGAPTLVDRPGTEPRQAEAATLVEAQGIDIVVGGHHPEPGAPGSTCGVDDGRDQGRPDAAAPARGVQREQLAGA